MLLFWVSRIELASITRLETTIVETTTTKNPLIRKAVILTGAAVGIIIWTPSFFSDHMSAGSSMAIYLVAGVGLQWTMGVLGDQ